MTLEEKAKAYDEAIKKAESLYKAAEPMSGCNVIIETLFPELKESEDERIRKTLIDFFSKGAKLNGTTNSVADKDIIAWLERQGEHANFRYKIQVGDKVTRNEAGVLVNLSQLERAAKSKEKKIVQKVNYTTIAKTGDGGINAIVTRELPIDDEQKPSDKVNPKDYSSIDPHFGKSIDK